MYNPNMYMRAQVPGNNIIWVQGIEGAKAQQIQPNTSLLLLDSESDHFYMKVCDQYGICLPLRTFKFEEEIPVAQTAVMASAAAPEIDMSQYVTKAELENLIKELKSINEQPISTTTSVQTSNKYTTIPTSTVGQSK